MNSFQKIAYHSKSPIKLKIHYSKKENPLLIKEIQLKLKTTLFILEIQQLINIISNKYVCIQCDSVFTGCEFYRERPIGKQGNKRWKSRGRDTETQS